MTALPGISRGCSRLEEFSRLPEHEAYDELHDLAAVTAYNATPDTLARQAFESVAQEDDAFAEKFVAVVAPNDVSYGMARVYSGNHAASKESIEVFRNLDDALAWLHDNRAGRGI